MPRYDESRFGVVERKWFYLKPKWGGDNATGIECFATTDATSGTILTRWYPKGPITMKKFGALIMATMTGASNDLCPIYLKTRGASGSAGCTLNVKNTSTAMSQAAISSTETFTVSQVKAGEYIYVRYGTPKTDKGTAANTASTTGTFAMFLDYVRRFDPDKWY